MKNVESNRNTGFYIRWIAAAAISFQIVLMALIVSQYVTFELDVDFLLTKQYIVYKWHYQVAFYVHIFSGLVVLIAGLPQFSMTILKSWPKLHHRFGWAYIVGILVFAGPGGIWMALYANGGFSAKVAFVLQGILWMVFTAFALRAVFRKQWITHREWMIRSYALTLAALTLRLYSFILPQIFTVPGAEMYQTLAWISWVPNLIVAEILIRGRFYSVPRRN